MTWQEIQIRARKRAEKDALHEELTEALSNILLGEKIPLDVVNAETGEIVIPANRRISKTLLRKVAGVYDHIDIDPSPIRNKIREIIAPFISRFAELEANWYIEHTTINVGISITVQQSAYTLKSVKARVTNVDVRQSPNGEQWLKGTKN